MNLLYFGCWISSGHYLWDKFGRHVAPWNGPFTDSVDTKFCPHYTKGRETPNHLQVEGEALLHHVNGYSILAFWDRSVDTRFGSNSALIAQGTLSFLEMIELFKTEYPSVWGRFKFQLKETS